jgi:hypothetical protein
MVAVNKLIVILAALLCVSACQKALDEKTVLFDFESDTELDQLRWSCHTLFSLSGDHATRGSKSLKMELFPSAYPGLVIGLPASNWSSYGEVCFDAYNPMDQSVRIEIRIDDRKDSPNYGDRYNKSFVLERGSNRIVIPLETVTSSGTNRPLNLGRIYRLFIFMNHPVQKTVLFVDNISLLHKLNK